MKTKDIITIAVIGILLTVGGFLIISNFGSGSKTRTAEIEVVTPISTELNGEAQAMLLDNSVTRSFDVPVNLRDGFGNTNPFVE